MSFTFYKREFLQPKTVLPSKLNNPDKTFGCSGLSNPTPIEYNSNLELKLIKLSLDNYPQFRLVNIPTSLPPEVRSNLSRTWISLRAYYESKNPVMGVLATELAFRKEGATRLKQIRSLSLLKYFGTTFLEDPEWLDPTIPIYNIEEIGDIFYYKYCFHWEEECNDYLECLIPLSYEAKYVKKFRKVLIDELDSWNYYNEFEPEEILHQFSSSSCKTKKGRSPNYIAKQTENGFRFGPRRSGDRCVVQVHPEGARDTIINNACDRNTIQAIDKLTSILLYRNKPKILVDKDYDSFQRKLSEFKLNHDFFYCRDIHKEGITKPKYLLKIMLEELSIRCPKFKEFCSPDFYDGPWVSIDGHDLITDRGHGLGMANSLTTLMQLIIFEMSKRQFYKELYGTFDIDALILNDDTVFAAKNQGNIDSFADIDDEILAGLGLIRKKTKSFQSSIGFTFCEEYRPLPLNAKESIKRREGLLPLTAVNIAHAKMLTNVVSQLYLSEIITYWGYEFYPTEYKYPREVGGWISDKYLHVSFLLKSLEEEYSPKHSRAYFANKENKPRKFGKSKFPKRENHILYIPNSTSDRVKKLLNICSLEQISKKFFRPKHDKKFVMEWELIRQKRQTLYRSQLCIDFKQFSTILLKEEDTDYYPPEFAIERYVLCDSFKGLQMGLYQWGAPICSALRELYKQPNERLPCSTWPLEKENCRDKLKDTEIRKFMVSEFLENYTFMDHEIDEYILPKEEKDFEDLLLSYKNPFELASLSNRINLLVPILKPEYRKSYLEKRRSFYGRLLTRDETIKLAGQPFYLVKFIIDNNVEDIDYMLDLLTPDPVEETPPPDPEIDYPEDEIPEPEFFPEDLENAINRRTSVGDFLLYPSDKYIVDYLLTDKLLTTYNEGLSSHVQLNDRLRGLFRLIESLIRLRVQNSESLQDLIKEKTDELLTYSDQYPNIVEFWTTPRSQHNSDEEVDFLGDFDIDYT